MSLNGTRLAPATPKAGNRTADLYTFGKEARRSDIWPCMVRHCGSVRLLSAVARTEAGHCQYGAVDVHSL